MSDEPEFIAVELNLEESGVLCHPYYAGKGQGAAPWFRRMEALYVKLADANDVLMGKKLTSGE